MDEEESLKNTLFLLGLMFILLLPQTVKVYSIPTEPSLLRLYAV
jgi:hypothetical protein